MSDIQWIKIRTDIFDDEKMKVIDSLPERDAIFVIWIKLLTLAGKVNDQGQIYLSENIPYTEEMLSTIFSRPLSTIKLAIATFERFGMIEINNNYIGIMNWEKHQNTDALDKIREQNRLRVQKHRETKALKESNVTVTLSNAVDKNRKEEEKKEEVLTWRNSFEVYKSELSKVYLELINNKEWIELQEKYYPGVDIKLSLQKACTNFWATEAGWKHKKSKRSKEIDWKATLTNAISMNKVYPPREQQQSIKYSIPEEFKGYGPKK